MPKNYKLKTVDSNDSTDGFSSISVALSESVNVDVPTEKPTDDDVVLDSHVVCTNAGFEEEEKTGKGQGHIPADSQKDLTGTSDFTGTSAEHDKSADEDSAPPSTCFWFVWLRLLKSTVRLHRQVLARCMTVLLVLLLLAYLGFALYRQWGTESATRLWLVLAIVLWLCGGGHLFRRLVRTVRQLHVHPGKAVLLGKIVRWAMYLLAAGGAALYLALEVIPKKADNLISLAGIAILVFVAFLLSSDPERVNWHTVFWGLSLQFYLALVILRTEAGGQVFDWLGARVEEFIAYTDEGSKFVFGEAYYLHPYAFKSMPVIVFINSIIAAGYQLGVVQAIIASFGRFLAWCLDTTPIESVNTAANVFMGLAEAPLFIKPFLQHVTEAELFAIMAGGFASIAGSIVATVIEFGIPANHLLAASVMSAPAALAISKVMCPDKKGKTVISAEDAYNVNFGESTTMLAAMSNAAGVGVTIAVSVCANILVFVALLAFADATMEWFAEQAGLEDFTFSRLLAYIFYPLMYVCGVEQPDLLTMGRLSGKKIVTIAVLSYQEAADIIRNSEVFRDYTTTTNGTWHEDGFDVVLDGWNQTLVGGVLTERSIVMSTYILCGFSNIPSIGICLGSLTSLAPSRTPDILRHVVWACVAGNIACFLTGCVAGLLYI